MIEKFKDIFVGLERAHGVTYVDQKGNGEKIKGKSFVKRDPVTDTGVYQIAKGFAEKNSKGLVKVKHGTDESKSDSPY